MPRPDLSALGQTEYVRPFGGELLDSSGRPVAIDRLGKFWWKLERCECVSWVCGGSEAVNGCSRVQNALNCKERSRLSTALDVSNDSRIFVLVHLLRRLNLVGASNHPTTANTAGVLQQDMEVCKKFLVAESVAEVVGPGEDARVAHAKFVQLLPECAIN